MSRMTGEPITITLTKENHKQPLMKQGDIVITNMLGKKWYNIVKSDSVDNGYLYDEDLGDSSSHTITLKKLSKYLIIRKIQVLYYKIKFKLQS